MASYSHVAFAVLLFGFAVWFAVTGEARFDVGGGDDSNRRAIHVNAHGLDAVAIGVLFAGVGLLAVAQGLRGQPRIPFFWAGLAVLGAAVVYGLVAAARAVIGLFR